MINDEREKNDKEKITIKFLLPNNAVVFIGNNDERESKR